MNLDEIMDRVLPFDVSTSTSDRFIASFDAGGRTIEFQADYEDEGRWTMGFGEKRARKMGPGFDHDYGKTGSGKEFEVFATIRAIVKRFIRERQPVGIRFTADHADGNRAGVYAKMLKRNVPDGWKIDIDSEDEGWGEDGKNGMTFFFMMRESTEQPRTYKKRLRDAAAIAAYIEEVSSGYVDTEFVEEHYFGCEAVLEKLPIGQLREGPADGNVASASKEKKYAGMPALTAPPLVVENGVVADGNHRFRAAVRRGDTHVWCYVVNEKD